MKLNKEISDELLKSIDRKKTPFGNNSVFNSVISDGDFLEDLAMSQFDLAKQTLLSLDEIEGVNEDESLNTILSKLINKCKERESVNKVALEQLCVAIATKLFMVPSDSITIKSELVDKVDCSGISLDKEKGEYSLDSINDNNIILLECDKRRILNSLCIGAGLYYSTKQSIYENEIEKIDAELLKLYKAINAINMYLLFDGVVEMTEKENKVSGIVLVRTSGVDKMPEIHAQGLIFPILLSETIRGLMELFAMHGLPKDKDMQNLILNKCDYLKSEPWYMRVGLELWKNVRKKFESKGGMIPYWFKELSVIRPMKFSEVMPEILSDTTTGKKYSKLIYKKAIRQFDKDNFNSDMSKLTIKKNVITDNTL